MKMKPSLKVSSLLFILSLIAFPAFAKVTVDPGFQGSLMITTPDGDVQLVEPGQTLPEIAPNSLSEVFNGQITLSTDEGESVLLSCLGTEASVGGGSSATLACSEEAGNLKVTKGSAHVKDPAGNEKDVPEGQEYPITLTEATAAPTGQGEETGTETETGNEGVPDSRSIEASPAA